MTPPSPDTLTLIDTYRSKSWTFALKSVRATSDSSIVYSHTFKSPRLDCNAFLPGDFSEGELKLAEAKAWIRQTLGGLITAQFHAQQISMVNELAKVQVMVDDGVVGAAMPTHARLNDLTIWLDHTAKPSSMGDIETD